MKNFKLKNWLIWLIVGMMKFGSKLPLSFYKYLVLAVGWIIKPLLCGRNVVARENLKIAFPDKSYKEIKKLANKSYYSMVLSGAEIIAAWFASKKKFKKIQFEWEEGSLERFLKYHDNPNQNLIIVGFHFHCMEIIGRYLGSQFSPFTVMYQKNNNDLAEGIIKKYREKNLYKCFDSNNFVPAVKSLKKGHTIWYAPDQDFGLEISGIKNSVFAPFFGKLCSTLVVTPWLAEKTEAIAVPAYYVREKCLKKYKIFIGEKFVFKNNAYEDAKMTNKFLEDAVKKYPEQYLWQHRRYRTRPDGELQIY